MSSQENNPNYHDAAAAPKRHRKICEMYNCREIARYGFLEGRKTRCKCHQMSGMIRL